MFVNLIVIKLNVNISLCNMIIYLRLTIFVFGFARIINVRFHRRDDRCQHALRRPWNSAVNVTTYNVIVLFEYCLYYVLCLC